MEEQKYILRRWRGNGMIIPDIEKPEYADYARRIRKPLKLQDVFVKYITKEEYEKRKSK
jgi:hypothetical protein